jgi:hypothetical protein
MSDERDDRTRYEAPRIQARADIGLALIAGPAVGSTQPSSAMFRAASGASYEPPRIEARAPVGRPLIMVVSPPPAQSAAFRHVPDAPGSSRPAYQPPRIEARDAVDLPLIGEVSRGPCARFRRERTRALSSRA